MMIKYQLSVLSTYAKDINLIPFIIHLVYMFTYSIGKVALGISYPFEIHFYMLTLACIKKTFICGIISPLPVCNNANMQFMQVC